MRNIPHQKFTLSPPRDVPGDRSELMELPRKMAWMAGLQPARKLNTSPIVMVVCSPLFISHANLINSQVPYSFSFSFLFAWYSVGADVVVRNKASFSSLAVPSVLLSGSSRSVILLAGLILEVSSWACTKLAYTGLRSISSW